NCLGRVLDVRGPLPGWKWPFGDELREGQALDVIHGEVVLPSRKADFVNGHNVRVLETGGSGGLGAKTLDEILACERPSQKHFHGDNAAQAHLPRAIDHAHPAAGDLFEQLVVAKPLLAEHAQSSVAHGTYRGSRP